MTQPETITMTEVTQADEERADALDNDLGFLMENERAILLEHLASHRTQALAAARAEAEALRGEVERLREALRDPNAVHVNMLRGDIALPTVHQMIHIYSPAKVRDGLETYARTALASEPGK